MADKKKVLSPTEFYKKLSKEDRDKIVDLQKVTAIDFIPTGSWVIDSLIGDGTLTDKPGGLPRGHIVEIFGDESSGKTTLALSAIRQVQQMGGFAALFDFEQTFHPVYAQALGVNMDRDKLLVMTPLHFQHGARLIVDVITQMKPLLVIVDSVSAMTPQQVIDGSVEDGARVGLQAALMSAFLQYISKYLKDNNTCLLFLNQLRSVIKKSKYDPGPDEETSGGRSIRYYSSVRLRLRKGAVEKIDTTSKITGKAGKEPVNVTVNVTVIKNKIDKPWRAAPVYIRFGEGIDNVLSIVELAINTKVIAKEGSSYTFTHKDGVLKCVGKEKLRKILEENEKLFDQLRANLILKEDDAAKVEYKNQEAEDAMDDILNNTAATFIEKVKTKKRKKVEAEEQTVAPEDTVVELDPETDNEKDPE